jgi:hypothetical protein
VRTCAESAIATSKRTRAVSLDEAGDEPWKDLRRRAAGHDVDDAGELRLLETQLPTEVRMLFEHRGPASNTARPAGVNDARATFRSSKRCAVLGFEARDAARHRRLGATQVVTGGREAAGSHDGDEDVEGSPGRPPTPSPT